MWFATLMVTTLIRRKNIYFQTFSEWPVQTEIVATVKWWRLSKVNILPQPSYCFVFYSFHISSPVILSSRLILEVGSKCPNPELHNHRKGARSAIEWRGNRSMLSSLTIVQLYLRFSTYHLFHLPFPCLNVGSSL